MLSNKQIQVLFDQCDEHYLETESCEDCEYFDTAEKKCKLTRGIEENSEG